jgi:hypothetical protein
MHSDAVDLDCSRLPLFIDRPAPSLEAYQTPASECARASRER